MGYALITGASAGLGSEFARLFVKDGYSVVLVARRKENLEKLKTELKTLNSSVEILVHDIDLGVPDAGSALYHWIKSKNISLEFLINNAGFGDAGEFAKLELSQQLKMIDLNIRTLVELCHLYAKEMLNAKRGRILNVGSTAGFQPGPYMTTYYASKAFVNSFSEALGHELKGSGVTCTCLAPGPTHTEFAQVAGFGNSKLFKSKMVANSAEVAKAGYDAMLKGEAMCIPGAINNILAQSTRFVPRSLTKKIAGRLNRG